MTPRNAWLYGLLLISAAGHGQTLDEAVRIGLSIHPQVRAAVAEAERGKTDVDISKGGYYPQVSLSGGPNEFDFGEVVYDVTASQMLFDWGRMKSKVDSAKATHRQLDETALVSREDAALDIVETYLDVLAAQARIDTVREHIQRLGDIREMTQARGGDGYSDRSELDLSLIHI